MNLGTLALPEHLVPHPVALYCTCSALLYMYRLFTDYDNFTIFDLFHTINEIDN